TVPGQAERIIQHLDRYLIREKVTLRNRSGQWAQWLLAGPGAETQLSRLTTAILTSQHCTSAPANLTGITVWPRRVDLPGPVGFRFEGAEVPPAGTQLHHGDQTVGEVTSSTFSPRLGAPLALAYIRRPSNAVGTRLRWASALAEVITLPIA